ncbi:unnamed protein product [Amoebophrya sp. A25]|nr:unnamed protein product [Amoebophrya sp. A25]|eukprot:GSA25T00027600001.1
MIWRREGCHLSRLARVGACVWVVAFFCILCLSLCSSRSSGIIPVAFVRPLAKSSQTHAPAVSCLLFVL